MPLLSGGIPEARWTERCRAESRAARGVIVIRGTPRRRRAPPRNWRRLTGVRSGAVPRRTREHSADEVPIGGVRLALDSVVRAHDAVDEPGLVVADVEGAVGSDRQAR